MQSLHGMKYFVAGSDVTRQQYEVNAAANPSAAISMKTNAQLNGQQRRIYTSTPIANRRESQQQRNDDDAIGFCNLAKATAKRYICVGGVKGQELTFDVRLIVIILLFAIIIIGYRLIIIMLAMPYINGSSGQQQQLRSYVQAQLSAAFDWSEQHQVRSKLSPVLCGLLVAAFFYLIVYLDSAVPGVDPPAPFSPRSKQRYRQKSSALQLNYLIALGSGILLTFLMYVDL
ncbi:uncharacterized protein LOC6560361 isoform X2 [Drosophila grimshawi]|nr:uncharacterized protein LOC6560361 isoform X2 [Drosophila grimshawi]